MKTFHPAALFCVLLALANPGAAQSAGFTPSPVPAALMGFARTPVSGIRGLPTVGGAMGGPRGHEAEMSFTTDITSRNPDDILRQLRKDVEELVRAKGGKIVGRGDSASRRGTEFSFSYDIGENHGLIRVSSYREGTELDISIWSYEHKIL